MNLFKNTLLLFIIIIPGIANAFGINATIQKPWKSSEKTPVISTGILINSKRVWWQYYEVGFVMLPGVRKNKEIQMQQSIYQESYLHSLYGLYTGYYIIISPLLRPGVLLGSAMKREEIYQSQDDEEFLYSYYSDYSFDYYLGFSIQVGMFSFVLSNYSIGGGINLSF
jgi:hypothetical protein